MLPVRLSLRIAWAALVVGALSCSPATNGSSADGRLSETETFSKATFEEERRARARTLLSDYIVRLSAVHKDRLAGLYYQVEPDFRIIVLLTGDMPPRWHPLNESPVADVPVEFRLGAENTADQLKTASRNHEAEIPAAQGIMSGVVDERTKTIVTDVYGAGRRSRSNKQMRDPRRSRAR